MFWRSDDFASIRGEYFHRVAIDVAEDEVLGATGEDRDSIFFLAVSGSDGRN